MRHHDPAATPAQQERRSRAPVPRVDGAAGVRLLAVSFGVTVVGTRLYLSLTGYPQIGGGEYHIAHALWGGLLLVIGGVISILWSNPWVQRATALCTGVGCGLFIDEIGKFITARNDYFTPLAAPIIYVFFLAVLGVAVLARRAPLRLPRSLAYTLLVRLKGVVDGPVPDGERAAMLREVAALEAATSRPDLGELARRLRPVVESAAVERPAARPVLAALARVERAIFPRWLHRLVLILSAALLGLLSLIGLAVFVLLAGGDPDVKLVLADTPIDVYALRGVLLVASFGETVVGGLLLLSAVGLLCGRDRAGVGLGRAGLIAGLGGVNVVLGYVNAETVVSIVVVELVLLALYRRYRSRFLAAAHAVGAAAGPTIGSADVPTTGAAALDRPRRQRSAAADGAR